MSWPTRACSPSGDGAEADEECQGHGELHGGLGGALGVAQDGLEQRQVEGEEDVLDDDDAQDQSALGVG